MCVIVFLFFPLVCMCVWGGGMGMGVSYICMYVSEIHTYLHAYNIHTSTTTLLTQHQQVRSLVGTKLGYSQLSRIEASEALRQPRDMWTDICLFMYVEVRYQTPPINAHH